ncbi:Protein FAR1-RELATED SEQUENCE 5 [Glycine max]|nr:Protein FAR1-RELATED SEQUENCE 5 [Glycine max]
MDEDQWTYDYMMSQEVHMDYDYDNEEECGVNEPHVDCSNAFNMSQARTVAHENGFVAVIMRSDTDTGSRGRSSFVLIGCERSGMYKCRNKGFVRRDTGSRKCGCPFRLRGKPVHGREGWMVKLICGIHSHELAKSLVGHPYVGRLTKDEKKIIVDMTKSMVKPKNILLTLKEHNANNCTMIKQIYNARSAYRSSIRGADTEMQHLMKLLEHDQYIHWHRLKDEVVVRDLFWCHPDAVKLCNACHLIVPTKHTGTDSHYLTLLEVIVILLIKMDEDQWAYYSAMSEEVDMDFQNEEDCGVNEAHVFETREDVLKWARTVAHENGFVAVIMRSDTYTGSRGRTSFVLIGCERSGKYKGRKKEFVRKDTGTRKCGCPFKIHGKPVHGGEGWAVKLICGIHNHELAKTLVGHPYAGRLTDDEKNIIADMTKSNVKPRNILLTLKEHNSSSCTTIKQIYNARSAYRSSIRGDDSEMQHLMRLLEHSTYKTNRYRLPLLDIVGVTPTGMTFSAGFAYLEGERVNNLVWALERFRGLFLRNDRLPVVIVTDRDLALMNAVKVVFLECKNLLCRFHIDKNVKAKCKSLVGQKNAWDYVMDSWGNLVDCPSEQEFPEHLQRFQVACSPWPMFIDYVCETWIVPHKEKFILAWTNKVMHLGNTTTNRVESAHWSLKRILQNSVGDLCSVWDAMNNMMMLQHTEIRASFETSTHVVGHVFKKTLYKRLLGMVSMYALNEISVEFERVRHLKDNVSSCGCVLRTTLGLPCACELQRYEGGSIPLDAVHMYWRRLNFSDQGLCEAEVSIKEEMGRIYKRFNELDVCGKVTFKSKLREFAFPDETSMCPPPTQVKTKGAPKKVMKRSERSTKRDPSYWEYVDVYHSVQNSNTSIRPSASSFAPPKPAKMIPMLDQFPLFMHGFIEDVVDVKADGNCGYWSVSALLGMGEECWAMMHNKLIKELGKWSQDYIKIFGGTERYEQLRLSLHVDGLSKYGQMDGYNRYGICNCVKVILVSLSRQQSFTFFPLRSRPPANSAAHRIICVGHVYGSHFVQVFLKDRCPLPPMALLWSSNAYLEAKQWPTAYVGRMQQYLSLMTINTTHVDLSGH